jgi:hypothetical protein
MYSENNHASHFIVGSLPMTEDSIPPGTLGHEVAARFQSFPNLSGLLIVEGDRLYGMVSCYEYNQRLAKQFGVEVSYWRPILSLFEGIFDIERTSLLVVEEESMVKEVVECCLQRNENLIYEPIIVHRPKKTCQLLRILSTNTTAARCALPRAITSRVQQGRVRHRTRVRNWMRRCPPRRPSLRFYNHYCAEVGGVIELARFPIRHSNASV